MYKIITDSSANLPENIISKYGIKVISFRYKIDDELISSYEEGKEFDGKSFFDAMRDNKKIMTSMINTEAYKEYFEYELKKGNDVIYIAMSGGISGSSHSARLAAEELSIKYKEKVKVVDTLAASLGEGLVVLKACEYKAEGLSFDKNVARLNKYVNKICQYFTVEDLMYLKRGGRISAASAFVGTVLNIKPILYGDNDGKIVLKQKVRGRRNALDTLAEKYKEFASDPTAAVGIAHADCQEDADYLIEKLKANGLTGEVIKVWYEPVTGAHVGPGTVALFFESKHR